MARRSLCAMSRPLRLGNLPRLGIAGKDGDNDIVQGIVLMRRGAESLPTIKRVEALINSINHSTLLPPGVHIEKIYDRSDLINVTTHTVLHNMLAGIVLIFIVQWVFLGNLRAACITAATIPFALAFAIGLLLLTGESANLLSVGAIDFGLVVDATVILVENVVRRLSQPPSQRFQRSVSVQHSRPIAELRGKFAVIGNTDTILLRVLPNLKYLELHKNSFEDNTEYKTSEINLDTLSLLGNSIHNFEINLDTLSLLGNDIHNFELELKSFKILRD